MNGQIGARVSQNCLPGRVHRIDLAFLADFVLFILFVTADPDGHPTLGLG